MVGQKKIKVLIADDSALIREIVGDHFRAEADIEVIGRARDGVQAVEMAREKRPDVLILDIEMPNKNGLDALREILAEMPLPVVMFSSIAKENADVTFEALEIGAVDYVTKPTQLRSIASICGELASKIRTAARTNVKKLLAQRVKIRTPQQESSRSSTSTPAIRMADTTATSIAEKVVANKVIAIGISTGGPPALTRLFAGLQPPLPPILIVQHMPPGFTKSFADRLDRASKLAVKEAVDGDLVFPNAVYIAPGGKHMRVKRTGGKNKLEVFDGEVVSGHRPSVDVLFESVACVFGREALGLIMTGMGRDGVDGCDLVRAAGGFVLGQDEESSDVYGMNRIAFVDGHVDEQFHLDDGAKKIYEWLAQKGSKVPR